MKKTETSTSILDKLLRNEHVSRWDIFRKRVDLKRMIENNEKYHSLEDEVLLTIDMARESL